MPAPMDTPAVLPPLASPPRWAAGQPPDWETVDGLRQQGATVRDRVWSIRMGLSALPGPRRENLDQFDTATPVTLLAWLVSALRAMPYPPELTAWVNEARVMAAHAASRFDDAIAQIQHLRLSSPDDVDYYDHLARVHQRLADVLRNLEQLLTHLNAYLDAEEARPYSIVRDITWRLGRQAGLHEIPRVLDEALGRLSEPLAHEQAQELRVALLRLLEQQRLAPHNRLGHAPPLRNLEAL